MTAREIANTYLSRADIEQAILALVAQECDKREKETRLDCQKNVTDYLIGVTTGMIAYHTGHLCLTPPTPVWCEHIYRENIDGEWHWFLKTHENLSGTKVHDNCNACTFCGSPKPETKEVK